MQVIASEIPDVKIIIPDIHGDARGWFVEQYNAARYKAAGITADFVQDNESFSHKGVVRGLHWQAVPYTQAKLFRVIQGTVWDVAVDIRKGSPTYGKHVSVVLTAENRKQFFIPAVLPMASSCWKTIRSFHTSATISITPKPTVACVSMIRPLALHGPSWM